MCYLVQLARSPRLAQVLWLPPYNMPEKLIQEVSAFVSLVWHCNAALIRTDNPPPPCLVV